MLGKFGETLVVDWGLAKPLGRPSTDGECAESMVQPSDSGADPTTMGSAVGTPAYMSPEQAAGRIDQFGPHTDVYGLGSTLTSVRTGKRPFADCPPKELLQRVQQGTFRPPRQVNKRVPAVLSGSVSQGDGAFSPRSATLRRRRPGQRPGTLAGRSALLAALLDSPAQCLGLSVSAAPGTRTARRLSRPSCSCWPRRLGDDTTGWPRPTRPRPPPPLRPQRPTEKSPNPTGIRRRESD